MMGSSSDTQDHTRGTRKFATWWPKAIAAALAGLIGVGAAAPAEARVAWQQAQLSNHAAYCFALQTIADVIIDKRRKEGNITGDLNEAQAKEQRALSFAIFGWEKAGCYHEYGSIMSRSQWTGEPSVWAVKSFEAEHVVAGNFAGLGGATKIVAFSRGDTFDTDPPWSKKHEMHVAARPLIPPTDGSAWGFESFEQTSPALAEFRGWATRASTALAGDFDGNGKDDIALAGDPNSTTVPVAFSSSTAWSVPVPQSFGAAPDGFVYKAREAGTKFTVGDFNADGKADIAAMNTGWTSISIARGATQPGGPGTVFTSHNFVPSGQYGSLFTQWAADDHVQMLAGDFNGDDFDDLLLVGKSCWDLSGSGSGPCDPNISPVAFGGANGFTAGVVTHFSSGAALNAAYGEHGYATHPVVGDFNNDGVDDVQLTWLQDLSPALPIDQPDKTLLPFFSSVSFSQSSPSFGYTAETQDQIMQSAIWPGTWLLPGDFDKDGIDDVAFVGSFDKPTSGTSSSNGTSIALLQRGSGGIPQLMETPVTSPVQPGYGSNAPIQYVAAPNVTGLTEEQATAGLFQAGLVRGAIAYEANCVLAGKVGAQSVAPGAVIPTGSVVGLTVHTQPVSCAVPNLAGLDEESARYELQTRGFAIGAVTFGPLDCDLGGLVASSSPSAGQVLAYGATVSLSLNRSSPACTPDEE